MHLEETTLLTVRPIDTCIYQTEQSGKEPLPPSVKHQTTEYHYTNPENIMSKGFLEKRRKKTADRFILSENAVYENHQKICRANQQDDIQYDSDRFVYFHA